MTALEVPELPMSRVIVVLVELKKAFASYRDTPALSFALFMYVIIQA